ncbi:MAG: helicase domain protein [Caudoviricetes sp.]|nr:MAG: helicase domain protein [Caudoviricetes sp.]
MNNITDFTKRINKIIGAKKIIIHLEKYKFKNLSVGVLYNNAFSIDMDKQDIQLICDSYCKDIEEKLNIQICEFIDKELKEIDELINCIKNDEFKNSIYEKINPLLREDNFQNKLNSNNVLNNVKNKFKKIKGITSDLIEVEKLKTIVSDYYDENEYINTFPVARTMKRKFIFHYGPTNSGKTHASLIKLKESTSGYYLAPLRLLAHEVYEDLNKDGYITDLVTGEEKVNIDGAIFRSSTIEMANFSKPVDVAIIDEIQMISDEHRGWAWTQAVVGIPAKTVILAGSEDALTNVKKLVVDILGEELEIVEFHRKNELIIEEYPTTSCKEGDAVIVFSRKRVLEMKEQLNNQCSVIYGSLGPEVRKSEANKFREGVNPIVVSTDAIGMGLNLPIRRVIFADIEKYNGSEYEIINSALIKQIAGRAGRFGKFENGLVTATDYNTLEIIQRAMTIRKDTTPLNKFQISPNLQAIKLISDVTGLTDIVKVLNQFSAVIENDENFIMMNIDDMREVSRYVYNKLQLDIKFIYSCAPINNKIANDLNNMYAWSKHHYEGDQVYYSDIIFYDSVDYNESLRLRTLEDKVKLLTVYLWLSQRFPEIYPDIDLVKNKIDDYNNSIMRILEEAPRSRKTKKLKIN